MRVPQQHPFERHHESGRAESALQSIVLDEGRLQGIKLVFGCQRFDCRDLLALRGEGQHRAGVDRPTIREHRAGAAFAVVAGALGACQPEVVAHRVEQRHARFDIKPVVLAIDLELDRDRPRAKCGRRRWFRCERRGRERILAWRGSTQPDRTQKLPPRQSRGVL